MSGNEGQRKAHDTGDSTGDEMGPTEKLRQRDRSEDDTLVPRTSVPGAQNPESEEIKDEKGPNTE